MKINIVTNGVIATVAVGVSPYDIVFDGINIIVPNNGSGNYSKVDINTNIVLSSIQVGSNPFSSAFDGTYIWVVDCGGNKVFRFLRQ